MKGMVVAPHSIAVEEGVKVLRNGGNAVDAAITAAFTQCVVGVGMCGIAGFGSMLIYMADSGEEKLFDFYGKAGSKATPDMWENLLIEENRSGYGYTLKGAVNDTGYQSITASGTMKAFHKALSKYGSVEWKDSIKPAIKYAENGYPISDKQAIMWRLIGPTFGISIKDKFKASAAAEEIFLKNGEPYNIGDLLMQKDLGKTLREISNEGPDIFYKGAIGKKITQDLKKNGSLLIESDWENYEVNEGRPLKTDYRGYQISTNPAPGGGITLIEILNILEGYDLAQYDWRNLGQDAAEHMHLIAMAFKAAQADRCKYIGDPAFVDVPTKMLISKDHASKWRDRIDAGERTVIPRWVPKEEASTTHVSAIDSDGNAVSLTHSIASISGIVTPNLGFLYNSCMNCFNPIPGHPNSIAPGKSRFSGISPTLVFEDGEIIMVIGAPGGNAIIGGVAQGMINILDHKMSPVEAVSAPRLDCQWFNTVDVSSRIPSYLCEELSKKGHEVVKNSFEYPPFPLVQAIFVDKENNEVIGGSDPRGGGIALSE